MFSIDDRNRIRDRVLQLADSDARVVAGAVVGSLALTEGDRWSDLDLTFAVADSVPHGFLPDRSRLRHLPLCPLCQRRSLVSDQGFPCVCFPVHAVIVSILRNLRGSE